MNRLTRISVAVALALAGGASFAQPVTQSFDNSFTLTANDDSVAAGESLTLRGGGGGVPIRNYFVGNNDNLAGPDVVINSGGTTTISGATTHTGTTNLQGATTSNGITNTGSVTTTTLGTTGNASIGGALTVNNGAQINGATHIDNANTATGDFNDMAVTNTGSHLSYRSGATGSTSAVQALSGGVFVGTYDSALKMTSGLLSGGAFGNSLIGATTSQGISNTGNVKTDTLTVTGATTTAGITNTGNVRTDTLTVTGAARTNGIDNGGAKITNVAPGTVSASSTDAINGSQLNQVVGSQAVINANQSVVNANQANVNANQSSINRAQARTNQQLQAQIDGNRKVASDGIAAATAMASMPALETGKKFGVGAGVGNYDGRTALALGVAARVSDQLQLIFGVSGGNGGKTAVGAGGMFSW